MIDTVARRIANRYRLGPPLGRGGMGRVYRGQDELLGRPVAVKLLYPDAISDADRQQACAVEARAAARLNHPGIVRILDSGVDDDCCFVVMELADGQSLATLLDGAGPLPIRRALAIAAQVADCLQAVHDAGIVHCDVKPANLIVSDDDRVRLVDFGIARITSGTTGLLDQSLQGSAKYVAPEQVEGGRVDARTDVYALGIVLYEMLAGVTPFEGGSLSAVLGRRLVADPPPLSIHRPDVPAAVEQTIVRTLARDPADRFSTAADFRDTLLSLLAAMPEEIRSLAPTYWLLSWLLPLTRNTAAQVGQVVGGAQDRLPNIRYGAVGVLGTVVAVALSLSLGGRVGIESTTAAAPPATGVVLATATPPAVAAITLPPEPSHSGAPQPGVAQPTSEPAPIPTPAPTVAANPAEQSSPPAPADQPPPRATPESPLATAPVLAAPIPPPQPETPITAAVPALPAFDREPPAAPSHQRAASERPPRAEPLKAEPPAAAPKPKEKKPEKGPEKQKDDKPEKVKDGKPKGGGGKKR